MTDYLERSKQLLGEDKIESLKDKTILVIGIGGVGGTAVEALARSGFKKLILIDSDKVDVSNLNRQVLFTAEDVGKSKVEVAKKRLLSISNDLIIKTFETKVVPGSLERLGLGKVDFIVDAIDFVEGKLHIYEYAIRNKIPFISSLGMGNRIDPEQVFVTKLNKTENDPLAKKIRYLAKQKGLDLKEIHVVFSKEIPLIKSPKPASMMMVPSTAGLIIAKYVLSTVLQWYIILTR